MPNAVVVVAREVKSVFGPVAERRQCIGIVASVDQDLDVQKDADVDEVRERQTSVLLLFAEAEPQLCF